MQTDASVRHGPPNTGYLRHDEGTRQGCDTPLQPFILGWHLFLEAQLPLPQAFRHSRSLWKSIVIFVSMYAVFG